MRTASYAALTGASARARPTLLDTLGYCLARARTARFPGHGRLCPLGDLAGPVEASRGRHRCGLAASSGCERPHRAGHPELSQTVEPVRPAFVHRLLPAACGRRPQASDRRKGSDPHRPQDVRGSPDASTGSCSGAWSADSTVHHGRGWDLGPHWSQPASVRDSRLAGAPATIALAMPKYDFRCGTCGREFEVSRPISQATDPATCPDDGSAAQRVFTMPMTFVKGDANSAPADTPPTAGGLDAGHGHSHGPGGHTHGPGGHSH
jgi:putative FmdB family regulatory protein